MGQSCQRPDVRPVGGNASPGNSHPRTSERGRFLGSRPHATPAWTHSSSMATSQCEGPHEGKGWPEDHTTQHHSYAYIPADLVVEGQELLEANFDKLTHRPTSDKLEWLAEMDTAWGAADNIGRGSRHALCSCYCSGPNPRMRLKYKEVLVNREGIVKWRRQHEQ